MRHFSFYLLNLIFISNIFGQEITSPWTSSVRADTLGIYDNDLLPPSFHMERRKAVRTVKNEVTERRFSKMRQLRQKYRKIRARHHDPL